MEKNWIVLIARQSLQIMNRKKWNATDPEIVKQIRQSTHLEGKKDYSRLSILFYKERLKILYSQGILNFV